MCLFVFAFSCRKKKTETTPNVGYDYAPTLIGKYVVYDVDSTVYDDFNDDTIYYKYRIKEKLEENFTDNQGRSAIKMVRYVKKYNPSLSYNNMPWVVKDVWNYTKTNTALEVVEEDVRFVKLIFPINEGAVWNGNAQNTLGNLEYKYKYINQAETINGTYFDNVLYVEQKDDKLKNVIRRQLYIEKFVKGVGLVYKEIKDLYSNTVVFGVPVEQRIEKGVIYKLTYVTHGTE